MEKSAQANHEVINATKQQLQILTLNKEETKANVSQIDLYLTKNAIIGSLVSIKSDDIPKIK